MRLKDMVRKKPITIDGDSTVHDVIKLMAVENIGFLVVMEGGKMVGVLSERDVIRALAVGKGLDAKVGTLCKRDIIALHEDATLEEAAKTMDQHKIRHVVVVNSDKELVGVISVRDILAELYSPEPSED
ncbi:MAG: CBS domain-containing protein [Aigarchaeota archaeon]|nr:CBS domain-containing protein [Candidatus Pelearchaeum maunauluense]